MARASKQQLHCHCDKLLLLCPAFNAECKKENNSKNAGSWWTTANQNWLGNEPLKGNHNFLGIITLWTESRYLNIQGAAWAQGLPRLSSDITNIIGNGIRSWCGWGQCYNQYWKVFQSDQLSHNSHLPPVMHISIILQALQWESLNDMMDTGDPRMPCISETITILHRTKQR